MANIKQIKWQCKYCGATMTLSQGTRPPVGSFCGKTSTHRHVWVKVG